MIIGGWSSALSCSSFRADDCLVVVVAVAVDAEDPRDSLVLLLLRRFRRGFLLLGVGLDRVAEPADRMRQLRRCSRHRRRLRRRVLAGYSAGIGDNAVVIVVAAGQQLRGRNRVAGTREGCRFVCVSRRVRRDLIRGSKRDGRLIDHFLGLRVRTATDRVAANRLARWRRRWRRSRGVAVKTRLISGNLETVKPVVPRRSRRMDLRTRYYRRSSRFRGLLLNFLQQSR